MIACVAGRRRQAAVSSPPEARSVERRHELVHVAAHLDGVGVELGASAATSSSIDLSPSMRSHTSAPVSTRPKYA